MLKTLLLAELIHWSQCYQITPFHPPISPSFDDNVLSVPLWVGINASIPTVDFTTQPVTDYGNQIPQDCFDGVTTFQFAAIAHTWDIDVYNVTFVDCNASLLVCHEASTEISLEDFLQTISRIPSNMRTSWKISCRKG